MPFRSAARVSIALLTAFASWTSVSLAAGGAPQSKKSTKANPAPLHAERATPGRRMPGSAQDPDGVPSRGRAVRQPGDREGRRVPREQRMRRAGSFDGDVRTLPQTADRIVRERIEREGPPPAPTMIGGATETDAPAASAALPAIAPALPAPPPSSSFAGLDFAGWGNGHPPDTNGDVGPEFYIETINTSLGIFRKTDGARVAAFTFNTFMSAGHFGNLCDTDNFGDPVVLYDTFEDRWVITDFAFKLDVSGNVVNPPGAFQCFAVSKTGDPLAGGWNYYSVNTAGGLGDYPKFGVWPDGIYMSANMFGYPAGASFQNPRVYAFNKAQMYAGAASIQVVSFDAPAADFTVLPSNARLQAGTPPPGTPNYFVSTWQFLNGLSIYKFHVDWDRTSLSTFTGPDVPVASTSWPNASVANAPSPGNSLDVLQIRAMMQNQYSNIEGAESLWATHTVRRASTTGAAAPRWYQVNVTGGVVAAAIPQAATWDPDGNNTTHRFMPSLAVDRAGDMALGYSTSSSTINPAIKYAGRLATDPINTFSQSEQLLIQGTGTQTGTCGGSTCTRWGDYSAMSLDPDGCTFWYTNMYYAVNGLNHQTRIGSFAFPSCTPVGGGALQGTVTNGAVPLAGVTLTLGSRTATTDGAGFFSFASLPAGTYPSLSASLAGYATQTVTSIAVPEGGTAVRNFTLASAPASACLTDTTQPDFQRGVATGCDLTVGGDVTLLDAEKIDQQNLTVTTTGFGFNATSWVGQTFTPAVTGRVTRIDLDLFCAGSCTSGPNLTVSLRATTGSPAVPNGADLATASIAGFTSGAGGYFSALFASPVTLTAGTRYAIVLRPVANPIPTTATYAAICSCTSNGLSGTNPYANGQRVTSANSGGTWTADTTAGGRDLGFKVFVKTGFPLTGGTYVSSLKDANPAGGSVATWGTIAWTANVPAGTSLNFQAAASNSPDGPFTFVGTDGTAATVFTNGASLSQFDGKRYLKYRASLGTTSSAATPTINDVTICFADQVVTSLSLAAASATYGGTTALAATLGGAGDVSGKSIAFTVNGAPVGSAATDAGGVAALGGVDVSSLPAGTYPIAAVFAGETGFTAATASNLLTIARAPQAIVFAPLPDRVATDPAFVLSATGGGSGNPVTFSTTSTVCSVSGNTVTLLAAGTCAIDADQAGDANYEDAARVTQSFAISAAAQTITFPAIAPFVWKDGSTPLAATASSGLPVSYAIVSGPCAVSGSTLTASAAGTCVVAADQAGNAVYGPAPQVTASATADKAPQAILFAPLPDRVATDPSFTIGATGGDSGNPVTFSTASTACSVSGTTVTLLASGGCAIAADQAGSADYLAAPTVTRSFTVTAAAQTIAFAPIPSVTLGSPDFTVTATASSGLPVSFSAAGPCTVSSVAPTGIVSAPSRRLKPLGALRAAVARAALEPAGSFTNTSPETTVALTVLNAFGRRAPLLVSQPSFTPSLSLSPVPQLGCAGATPTAPDCWVTLPLPTALPAPSAALAVTT